MPNRNLAKEISPSDMLRLRDEGMGNYEIAKSLDVSANTVYRWIGKQPGSLRRRWGSSTSSTSKEVKRVETGKQLFDALKGYANGEGEIDLKDLPRKRLERTGLSLTGEICEYFIVGGAMKMRDVRTDVEIKLSLEEAERLQQEISDALFEARLYFQ